MKKLSIYILLFLSPLVLLADDTNISARVVNPDGGSSGAGAIYFYIAPPQIQKQNNVESAPPSIGNMSIWEPYNPTIDNLSFPKNINSLHSIERPVSNQTPIDSKKEWATTGFLLVVLVMLKYAIKFVFSVFKMF